MKNLINYYYGILINDFKKINDRFVFILDNKNYEFVPFYGDINKLYKNYLTIIKSNKYCHEIVFNKEKNILTFYDNKPYILFKKNICINKKVDLYEITDYDVPVYGPYSLNWKKLWSDKLDYYEYQMSQLAVKYKVIKNSFDYYVGLCETAINLLNYVDEKNIKYYICHKRITADETLDEFFNPLNIIIDVKVRDVAEYIKFNFFNKEIDFAENEIISYLNNMNFTYTDILLFFIRLLYPSYYFDLYDKIIQEKSNETKLKYYIKKNDLYESFLKNIYVFIKTKYKIPEIEWLES